MTIKGQYQHLVNSYFSIYAPAAEKAHESYYLLMLSGKLKIFLKIEKYVFFTNNCLEYGKLRKHQERVKFTGTVFLYPGRGPLIRWS